MWLPHPVQTHQEQISQTGNGLTSPTRNSKTYQGTTVVLSLTVVIGFMGISTKPETKDGDKVQTIG